MTAMRLKRYPSPSGGIALGKMGVGARMIGWKNPYVTDGLILQWDGEWNAGGGLHDATRVASIKDIVGDNDLPIVYSDAVVSSDAVVFDGSQGARCSADFNISNWLNNAGTVEIVASYESVVDKADFDIGTTASNNRGLRPTTCSSDYYNQVVSTAEYRRNTYGVVRFGGTYTVGTRIALSFVTNPANPSADVYSNGIFLSAFSGGTQTVFNNTITIGTANWITPYPARPMHLCDFRMYSRALTASEIAANYAIDKERFNLP